MKKNIDILSKFISDRFCDCKDEFGLVFFGTEGTRNPLSYENVEV